MASPPSQPSPPTDRSPRVRQVGPNRTARGEGVVFLPRSDSRPPHALASYNYRLFLSGQLVSQSGGWMHRIAQAWLVLDLTESPAALGTVVTLQFLPILLFSLFAGALADRFPKRRVLSILQMAGALQALLLAVLVATGQTQLWHVWIFALVLGLANAMEHPVRQAFPAELVGRELIGEAVALNSAVHNVARIVGPALGGVVVAWLDLPGAFLMNGLGYLAVLVALALMRGDEIPELAPREAGGMLAELGQGLAFAARTPPIVFTLIVITCLGTFGFNYSTFLPLLARYGLELGPSGYGMMSAALGAGALVGALGIARHSEPSPGRMVVGGLGFAGLLGIVGMSSNLAVSLALLAAMGVAGVIFSTTANTTVQLAAPDAMRGRIMGLYTVMFMGMTPPGATVTGTLADAWGIRTALQIEAVVCVLGLLVGLGYLAWARRQRSTVVVTEAR